jgi:UDP-N-acetylmuramoyl-L-alanyl-D-glutamate--2,6-diaminopimelate ligase
MTPSPFDPTRPPAAGVCRDSRRVRPGQVYVAMGDPDLQPGHAAEAVRQGASAVVVAEAILPLIANRLPTDVPVLTTPDARAAFAHASSVAHGLDRRCPPLLAMVGTAGKSTTTHCAWWMLGTHAARVGTIGWHDGTGERPNPQTTPPPEELHVFLAGLTTACPGVAMEVSSHACDQSRCAGLRFAGMVFTGIGHDHLDYHRHEDAYVAAKLSAFRWLAPGGLVVINANDRRAALIAEHAHAAGGRIVMLGFAPIPAFQQSCSPAVLSPSGTGWSLTIDGRIYAVPMPLPGAFNAWNAAAAALCVGAVGVPLDAALARLTTMPAVPGRLELLARTPDTYVDYAHTPDELATMLGALRTQFPGRRLVCLFGCGGDRDRSKRGPMGHAALAADAAVLTTDNSRSEDPAAIANDVIAGMSAADRVRLHVEPDRATAIRLARTLAGADGIAVIAGKGHETTQIINGAVLPWDDRRFVASLQEMSA